MELVLLVLFTREEREGGGREGGSEWGRRGCSKKSPDKFVQGDRVVGREGPRRLSCHYWWWVSSSPADICIIEKWIIVLHPPPSSLHPPPSTLQCGAVSIITESFDTKIEITLDQISMSDSLSMTLIWGNKNSSEILPTNKLREMFHKTRSISNNLFAYSDLIRAVYRQNNCKIYNFQILGWKVHVLVTIGLLSGH